MKLQSKLLTEPKKLENYIMSINTAASAGSSFDKTSENVFEIGESVFIRTVTYAAIGTIADIRYLDDTPFLFLEKSAYVEVKNGTVREVEPIVGIHKVNTNSIVEVFQWTGKSRKLATIYAALLALIPNWSFISRS